MANKEKPEDEDQDQTTEDKGAEDQVVEHDEKSVDAKEKKPEEKDDIPDYEIMEETDDRLDKKSQLKPDRENKQDLTNREKRQLKKKRLAEKFDAKDALIRQQQEQINSLAARQNAQDARLSSYDQAQFTQVWNASVEAFNAAEKKHADAFSAGDGVAATAAMREMYAAQRRIDDLDAFKQRANAQQPARQQEPNAPDQRIRQKAQDWAKKNDWFKPGGEDDDSAIADTIAAKLVKEGYDPKTDDYYEELDERLQKRGIGQKMDDDDDDDDEPVQVRAKPVRRAPPVGGGGGRGDMGNGKVAVSLPTAYIQTLKDNGYWDDVPKRNRLIAAYLKTRKEDMGA